MKYINAIKFISPEKNTSFPYNAPISIRFSSKEKSPADSLQFFLNGKTIHPEEKGPGHYEFKAPAGRTGLNALKITAFYPDNKRSTATQNIILRPDTPPRKRRYELIKTYAHDPKAYTQGLIYQDGILYEGTGQYGESGIRKTDLQTGKVLSTLNIDNQLFGEGITIYKDKIYQLTWTSRKGFVYDLETFSPESTFRYDTQGWGLTTIGDRLIMSDGSNKLYHIAPSSFTVVKEVEVYDHNGPVTRLNELEYINGLVWANIWTEDRIVMIDPETGEVKEELDMSRLLSAAERAKLNDSDDVLNGIAWNPEKKTVYVTGKRWSKLFEISVQ